MVNGSTNTVLRQLARVCQEGTLTGLSDRQMLERFVDGRDEAAFEVLVGRHGPMVFNVCRQLLRDPRDVEDAFQAVFLVLVRKAGVIRVEGSLGPWLYKVANRVAAKPRESSTAGSARHTGGRRDCRRVRICTRSRRYRHGDPGGARSTARTAPCTLGALLLARNDPRAGGQPARLSGGNRPQPAVARTSATSGANHAPRADTVGRGASFRFGRECPGGRGAANLTNHTDQVGDRMVLRNGRQGWRARNLGISRHVTGRSLDVMRIKKLAIMATVLVGVGRIGPCDRRSRGGSWRTSIAGSGAKRPRSGDATSWGGRIVAHGTPS